MRSVQIPYVSISLSRLRRGVTLCCWIVGLAATAQALVFCVAAFMDLRYEELRERAPTAMIVASGEAGSPQTAPPARGGQDSAKPIDPNRVLSKYDRVMAQTSSLAYGCGMVAIS